MKGFTFSIQWCIWMFIWLVLTHWGWVMQICTSKLTIIGSDNGLSPGRRQAIIWTNAGILLTGHLGTNLNEIFIEIHIFSFCLGLNVLTQWGWDKLADSFQTTFSNAFSWKIVFVCFKIAKSPGSYINRIQTRAIWNCTRVDFMSWNDS